MTKVTIIGSEPKEQKKLKPIEFVRCDEGLKRKGRVKPEFKPKDFDNIELISESNSLEHYDIMFAFDDNRSGGFIYYGHFNDGVVE